MRTALTERLGLTAPIIQAPMGGATSPALAAAVSNAGGLGMLALARAPETVVREQIRETRRLTNRPFGVNLILAFPQDARLAVCLEESAPVVSLFWGDPAPFIGRAHAAGATVIHTAGSAADATAAVAAGVDIILYCCGAYRAMNAAALKVYEAIRAEGTQRNVISLMQSRADLYRYLDYHAYERKLDELFMTEKRSD